jgi:hypothetical protein
MGLRGAPRQLQAGLVFLPFTILQLIFATGGTRLNNQVLPILLPFALRGVTYHFGRKRWSKAVALLVVCGVYVWRPDSIILGLLLAVVMLLAERAKVLVR